ncbi:unnamed protein product [Rotaria socialis]|uniref:Protein kinase domain-containing protein n=1 Tax=Rotaria socialis TaxID=392032 RepID=A0A817V4X9_9BILA|nr:unnamed protein product [Rotaria socialis]CAF3334758.1 unnamed protein product [Rotaria socialis]CAF4262594.1 unnamed protein product [Rotaria socialis]CAF4265403.1 unnamed protein product [Rotaria socialis]
MGEVLMTNTFDDIELTRIIQSNHRMRQMVQQATNEFLSLQSELLQQIEKEKFDQTIERKSKPLIDILKIQRLNKQVIADKVQLAFVGENSSGKTSLIHFLLESDPFLPSDVGSVSARIIHLTYSNSTEACLYVYQSINERHKEPIEKVNLSEYFLQPEPNWSGVKDAIQQHVARPDPEKIPKDSTEFAEWAKHFVKIQIPSKLLKLGIDLYDTPGLLFSDPPVLKKNLRDLIKTVIPTVVFMYENPSVISDTKDCFLALKEALGKQLDDTRIFFLNTKVDIGTIITNDEEINAQEFEKRILVNTREERKNLLLKAPGMAEQISQFGDFDIISVESQWDPNGVKMNQLTVDHLIQFVANSDLKLAKKVSALVLSTINSFFDFAFVTTHRTHEQLQELRRNADKWTENYFIHYQSDLDGTLRNLYDVIASEINEKMESIVQRAAKLDAVETMGQYIRTLVKEEIISAIINKFIEDYAIRSIVRAFFDSSLLNNADKNEFLVAVQQNLLGHQVNTDDETFCQLYLCKASIKPLYFICDILIETDEEDNDTKARKNSGRNELKKKLRQGINRRIVQSKNMERRDIAQQYLNDIRSGFMKQKNHLNQILEQWCEEEKQEVKEKIDEQYELAKRLLPQRNKAYGVTNKYFAQFAHIQCKLIIAQSLTSFNGHIPRLNLAEQIFIDDNKLFQFYSAEWLDKKDLIVKKLKNVSNVQYLEAHYYLELSKMSIPNCLPLLYLYENSDSELWMFFPKYECLENKINTLTIKNVFNVIRTIATCLQKLHDNELIHGNVNVRNIYIKNDDEYLLGDFHSTRMHETLEEYVHKYKKHQELTIVGNDIYSLGELGMLLYESLGKNENMVKILDEFKSLIGKCLDQDPVSRPKASKIAEVLKSLLEKV